MGFLLKSIFWIGIVCLFLPRDASTLKAPIISSAVSTTTMVDAAAVGVSFCQKQPEVCESVLKTTDASREILGTAAATLSSQFAKKQNKKNSAD